MITARCVNAACPENGVAHRQQDTFTLDDGTVVDLMVVPTLCGACGSHCEKEKMDHDNEGMQNADDT